MYIYINTICLHLPSLKPKASLSRRWIEIFDLTPTHVTPTRANNVKKVGRLVYMLWSENINLFKLRLFSKYYQQLGMYSLTHNRIRLKFPFTLLKCFLSGEIVTSKLNTLNIILCELWLLSCHISAPQRAGLDDLALLVYLEKSSSLTYKPSKTSLTKTTSWPINPDLVLISSKKQN